MTARPGGWSWGGISGGRRWGGQFGQVDSDEGAEMKRRGEGVDQVAARCRGSQWGQGDGEEARSGRGRIMRLRVLCRGGGLQSGGHRKWLRAFEQECETNPRGTWHCFDSVAVIVCQGGRTRHHRLGGLRRRFFLTVLEPGSPRTGCWRLWLLRRPLPWACRRLPSLCARTPRVSRVCPSVLFLEGRQSDWIRAPFKDLLLT